MRRGSTSTVVIAVAAALAGLTILLWGSSGGAPLVSAPQGTWGAPRISFDPVPATITPSQAATAGVDGSRRAETAVDWLLVGFLLLVVAVVLMVLRMLLNRERREDRDLTPQEDEELVALLEASGDDVRYRALSEADPRNAVVACWVALEEAVRRSGLRDDPSETASELTIRVLGRWQVDQAAITDLSEAYREARFSRHPVSEQQRDRAISALERIHEDLRQRVLDEQLRAAEAERAAAAERAGSDEPSPHGDPAGRHTSGGGRG